MRWTRRTLVVSTLASLATPAILRLACADTPQITLKLHHAFSAVSPAHDKFLAPWARKLEADSAGRIRIDIFPSMQLGGAPAQLFDQARDGVADIAWAMTDAAPGRFPTCEMFELPFVLSHRALVNSKAIEDFAPQLQDEFHEVRPLGFSCRDRGVLHTPRAIKSIADLKGLRLHVPNRLAGEAVRTLGAHGVSAPALQVPVALSAHAIDGCLDPWDAVPGLRLGDGLKNHTDFAEHALSSTTFVLAMNKQSYERLPRDLKTVIDDNAGQPAASLAGAMWDIEAKAVAGMARDRGDLVLVMSAEETAPWRKAAEPVVAAWQKQMKERKLDGGKLLAALEASLAKYAEEPEPDAPQPVRPAEDVVAEPQQPAGTTGQIKPEGFTRPRADAPSAEVAAQPAPRLRPSTAPAPTVSAAPPPPAPTPVPAPVNVPPKVLDIPL
jgi:TRAP-type transport system periplasmic protein